MSRRATAVALSAGDAPATEPARTTPGARGLRVRFVDLLRLVAAFQMVQGHTLDALLADDLRRGAAFDRWTWLRGLTSIAFMVAAGMSFHLSTLSRVDEPVGDRPALARRVRRGASLVVLGYLLHLPGAAFGDDPAAATRALHDFQMADVLQCIGVCILLLAGLTALVRRRRRVVAASLVLGALAFGLAPLTNAIDPDGPFRFALNYVTHRGGSLFPLLPWAGYVFAGVVVAEVALPRGPRTPVAFLLRRLFLCTAAALALAGLVTVAAPIAGIPPDGAVLARRVFKLGVVLGIATALAAVGRRVSPLPRPLQILSGETLVLYVAHLMLLYAGGIGLYRIVGPALSLGEAIAAAVALIAVTAAIGLGWSRAKEIGRARWAPAAAHSDGGVELGRSRAPGSAAGGGAGS